MPGYDRLRQRITQGSLDTPANRTEYPTVQNYTDTIDHLAAMSAALRNDAAALRTMADREIYSTDAASIRTTLHRIADEMEMLRKPILASLKNLTERY